MKMFHSVSASTTSAVINFATGLLWRVVYQFSFFGFTAVRSKLLKDERFNESEQILISA